MEERMKVFKEIDCLLDWEFEADQEDSSVWYTTKGDYKIVWDLISSTGTYYNKASDYMCMIKGWHKLEKLIKNIF